MVDRKEHQPRNAVTSPPASPRDWRVIAPDQRGHGESGRAADCSREGYLTDLEALMDHLGLDRAALLGHSLGAINATNSPPATLSA